MSRGRFILILTSLIFVGGFLFYAEDAVATPGNADHLVISEIQVAGVMADDEFIEIYNPTERAINLENWSIQYKSAAGSSFSKKNFTAGAQIPAHGWYLITKAGYAGTVATDMSHSTFSLAGSGGHIFLVNNQILLISATDPSILDKVGYGTGDSPEGTAAPAPPAGQSLERKPGGENGNSEDTDDNSVDFILQSTPQPQNTASPPQPPSTEPPPSPPPPPPSAPVAPPESLPSSPAEEPSPISICLNNNVIVNELLINPEDGGNEAEFVELYNQSNQEVDLSGWILEDTQGKIKTFVVPNGAKIGPLAFRIFYGSETKIIFNNSGDGIKLFDAGKNWCDSSPANSGAAKEGFSFSRQESKWFWTAAITPNSQNEVGPERETAKAAEVIDGDTIKLADGRKVRYIGINAPELAQHNQAAECFSREAWEKNKSLVLNQEVALERDVSDTDLYGRLLRYVYFKDIFINDYLVRGGFAFNSYFPPDGKYQSQLAEAQQAAQASQKGLWQTCQTQEVEEINKNSEDALFVPDVLSVIIINELLPNPRGPDTDKEFVELKNISEADVNLGGWRLETANRRKYVFSATSTISQKGFLVLWRQQSGLTLGNTREEKIKLFNPAGQLIDEVGYNETAGEEMSFSRTSVTSTTSTLWQWSRVATPGVANVIQLPNHPPAIIFELPDLAEIGEEIVFDASDTSDPEDDALSFLWDFGDGGQSAQEMATHTFQKAGRRKIILKVNDHQGNEAEQKAYLTVLKGEDSGSAESEGEEAVVESESSRAAGKKFAATLLQARELSAGDQARFSGLVTVPPSLFGTQIFYLQEAQTSAGIQIYMFKKDFPELKIGNEVMVQGEIGLLQNEPRLKIKNKEDIKILNQWVEIKPLEITTADLEEEKLSSLLKIQGEVLEPSSGQFYLADESGEVLVQFKPRTDLKGQIVKEGDFVEVVGILGQSKGIFRLWPRFLEDIKIIGYKEAGSGLETDLETNKDDGNEEKQKAEKYLTATVGGLTSLLLAFLAKSRGALAKTVALGAMSRIVFWRRGKKE